MFFLVFNPKLFYVSVLKDAISIGPVWLKIHLSGEFNSEFKLPIDTSVYIVAPFLQ